MNKEELRQYSAKLLGEKEELQQRIDKAIEYIKENCYYYDYKTYGSLTGHEVIELLEILKGEDKE